MQLREDAGTTDKAETARIRIPERVGRQSKARGAIGTQGDGCQLLDAMTLEYTPPENTGGGNTDGGTDKRAELSKCNNHERQWFGNVNNKVRILAMQAESLKINSDATMDQMDMLASKLEDARQAYVADWSATAEAMRSAGRATALTQATTKWNTIITQLLTASQAVEAVKQERLGTKKKHRQATSTPIVETPTARTGTAAAAAAATREKVHTAGQETDVMRQVRQEFELMRAEFADKERRMMEAHGRALEEMRGHYEKAAKNIVDEQQEKAAQQQKEIEQLKQQLNEASARNQNKQARQNTYETARDRLHRTPSPTRRRLNFGRGERGETEDVLGPLGDLGLQRNQQQQNNMNRQNAPSSILDRFGAFAGEVDMPATDPYQTTMRDEADDYYRNNFPPPFNQPPPTDAVRITEFRKLEGLVPKFSGREEEFLGWMSLYIPNIHRARCPVAWKATVLNRGMDSSNPTVRSIIDTSGATPEEYAQTIHKLVRAFAHPQGVVAAKLRALEDIVFVRETEHEVMEDWLIKLESYLSAAKTRGMQAEIFGVQLYEDNLARMEERLAHSYLMWSSLKSLPNNAVTICAWLEEKIGHAKQLRRRKGITENKAYVADRSRLRARSSPPGKRSPRGARTYAPRGASYDADANRETRKVKNTCPLDGERHDLANCDTFKALTPKERREKLRELRRCYACFMAGHNISSCNKDIRCAECPRYHHTLLHGSGSGRRGVRRPQRSRAYVTAGDGGGDDEEDSWSDSSDPESYETVAYKTETTKGTKNVVLQTVPIDVYNKNKLLQLNCLIDQGATGAFMSKRAAEALRVTGYSTRSRITGFDGAVTEGQVLITDVQVAAQGAKKRHWIQVQVTKDPAGSYTPFDWTKEQDKFKHIRNLPLKPPVPGRDVDIMLGMDTPELIRSLVPDIGGGSGQPMARFTRLGWVVGGPTTAATNNNMRANFAFKCAPWTPPHWTGQEHWQTHSFKTHTPTDARELVAVQRGKEEDIMQLLHRMWEIDSSIGKSAVSVQDEKIFSFLREELRMLQGKYVLPTIWKLGHPNINNNFKYAAARLASCMRSKQLRDPSIRQEYAAQIKDWKIRGYTEEVKSKNPEKDKAYYLPHFAVVRMEKASSKVRIVMDAAAKPSKTGNQLCLNDGLLKGPKLINELPTVLLRYRRKEVSIAADIKKMFFQIMMKKEDRDMHRFLWEEDGKMKIYRWAVHPFGSAASPCVAIFTIKEHAARWREKYPKAAETVIKSTLVDDNLDSCATVEEAVQLGAELRGLFKEAGMELGKVTSNRKEVMQSFPQEMRAESLDISSFCTEDIEAPIVKSLGIIYLSKEDAFSFEIHEPKNTVWTKRTILQHKAKLYDPHGLVAPHTITASIILQKVWSRRTDWDQPVEEKELKAWIAWLEASKTLPQLRVPRCVCRDSSEEAEIHFFCDASADAYAAVAYYVTCSESRLICCKSKVAPLKAISIPRLELLAAEVLLDVVKSIRQVFDFSPDKFWYWSDSTNVLSWIITESRTLNDFVGNRVAKIQEATDVTRWRWVDSAHNPADIPSRGMLATKLKDAELWWQGPDFLTKPRSEWPTKPQCLSMGELKEVKKSMAFTTRKAQPIDSYDKERDSFPHYRPSTWNRMQRAVARCKRMMRRQSSRVPISGEELGAARHCIITKMQECTLAKSMAAIVANQPLPQNSPLTRLDPFIDSEGLLRVGGRLKLTKFLPFEQRHQIIIPRDHPWTELLVRQTHENLSHQGPAHVLNELRKHFWIPSGRQLVRAIVARCVSCRRQKAQPQPQKMAPTIEDRFPESRCKPFTFTALDTAGPYHIKNKDQDETKKAYFILFTCCTIRAVHLEPIYDVSANSFLAALDRFTARRGTPRQVRSDNGTNFVAGLSELKKLWGEDFWGEVQAAKPQIKWIFNPPKAPYFGGLYERMIGAVKRALYHTARPNLRSREEAFNTMLTVAEGILNSRPITHVNPGVDEPEALTPAHFLGTGPYRSLAEAPGGAWDKRTLWRALQLQLDTFWARFCTEMKGELQPTQKWHGERQQLRAGDVVAVLEKKKRGKWPLGKIIRTETSRDGLVRKAHVMFDGNTVRRPVNTLVLLLPESAVAGDRPLEDEEDEGDEKAPSCRSRGKPPTQEKEAVTVKIQEKEDRAKEHLTQEGEAAAVKKKKEEDRAKAASPGISPQRTVRQLRRRKIVRYT